MDKTSSKHPTVRICLALALTTLAAFWQLRNCGFVNYDDNRYVTENRYVKAGLTPKGISWAFTTTHASNWHPLTWLSHMLDCELFGVNPRWHHTTNLLLHIANTLLLFTILGQMTGALWRSAFVAAVFAIHPLHVESVAWIAERKDVLSALFWMLTMAAYLRYVKRPTTGRYMITLLVFAFGLMTKPMLVTLPFVLLLLDYWPLGRFQLGRDINHESRYRLLWEKVPFFALSAISAIITYLAQQKGGAMATTENVPLNLRTANALVSYLGYIVKTAYPNRLAVLYPLSGQVLLTWEPIASIVILACVSAIIIRSVRRLPYLAVGWLWYLGTLVPVIGLIQVGTQAMADRYTYIPSIGILIMVAWGVTELGTKWRYQKIAIGISAAVVLAALFVCTRIQVRYWQNSFTLFTHALKVTENNSVMHAAMGSSLVSAGKFDEAVSHYQRSLRIKPDYAGTHNGLGIALAKQGNPDEAITHYTKAIQLAPEYADAHSNLGAALVAKGRFDEAISHYLRAVQLKPNYVEAHNNLATALHSKGLHNDAVSHLHEALRIQPNYAEAHNNLGIVLRELGRIDESLSHHRRAIKLEPELAWTHYNLGIALSVQGNLGAAAECFQQALQLDPNCPDAHTDLGAVLQLKGRINEAVSHYRQALQIAPNFARAHYNLGNTLLTQGKLDEAIHHLRRALQTEPSYLTALDSMAHILATHPDPDIRNATEAVVFAERAAKLTRYRNAAILNTLAAAYAEAGRFDKAVTVTEAALALASNQQNEKLANKIRSRLELYRQKKPYREPIPHQNTPSP